MNSRLYHLVLVGIMATVIAPRFDQPQSGRVAASDGQVPPAKLEDGDEDLTPASASAAPVSETKDVSETEEGKMGKRWLKETLKKLAALEPESPSEKHAFLRVFGALEAASRGENVQNIKFFEGIVFNNLFNGGFHRSGVARNGQPYALAWQTILEEIGGEEFNADATKWLAGVVVSYAREAHEVAKAIDRDYHVEGIPPSEIIDVMWEERIRLYSQLYREFLDKLRRRVPEGMYRRFTRLLKLLKLPVQEERLRRF